MTTHPTLLGLCTLLPHTYRSFLLMLPLPPIPTLFPYTTLFRSRALATHPSQSCGNAPTPRSSDSHSPRGYGRPNENLIDRKSTRLNSSHVSISYAVFCLKKKKKSLENR